MAEADALYNANGSLKPRTQYRLIVVDKQPQGGRHHDDDREILFQLS